MGNATRWYVTREAVKSTLNVQGSKLDAVIDRHIEAASADIERSLNDRRFIPYVDTKLFRWPRRIARGGYTLYLEDNDLLSVTTLQAKAQDASPSTITNYFVEPQHLGPPYSRIEIDLSSTDVFEAGNTPQRSISVLGKWGFSEETRAAGSVASGLASSASATSMVCSDASLVGVGDTLLIEDEQLFVSGRAAADTTATTSGALTADSNGTTVAVDDGTKLHAGEVILIDSEKMLIDSIAGNNLTVERAYDGTTLATHNSAAAVYAYRSLTVVRGVNGTTAATHANSTAVDKYAPPGDVVEFCLAQAIALHEQGKSGWTGQIGGPETPVETRMFNLYAMRMQLQAKYGDKVSF